MWGMGDVNQEVGSGGGGGDRVLGVFGRGGGVRVGGGGVRVDLNEELKFL